MEKKEVILLEMIIKKVKNLMENAKEIFNIRRDIIKAYKKSRRKIEPNLIDLYDDDDDDDDDDDGNDDEGENDDDDYDDDDDEC